MAIKRFDKDMEIIGKLGYNPGTDDGLSPEELQDKFDEGGKAIQKFMNDTLIPAIEGAEGGGIVMSDTQPEFSPVLWLKVDAGEQTTKNVTLIYIDAEGTEITLYPKTKAENIIDFDEKMQQFHLKKQDTLTVGKWVGASAPYTLTLSVPGVKADDDPHVGPVYSDDLTTRKNQVEAWSCVSYGKPGENQISFVCDEDKPGVDIPIQIEVNR